MSKPQDYEYMELTIRWDKADPFGRTLSSLALAGWEPIYTHYARETWWQFAARYHLLRRLRPDLKTEAAG